MGLFITLAFAFTNSTTIADYKQLQSNSIGKMKTSVDTLYNKLLDASPPEPPMTESEKLKHAYLHVSQASSTHSRSELWKHVPEWFDYDSGTFNVIKMVQELSLVLKTVNQHLVERPTELLDQSNS